MHKVTVTRAKPDPRIPIWEAIAVDLATSSRGDLGWEPVMLNRHWGFDDQWYTVVTLSRRAHTGQKGDYSQVTILDSGWAIENRQRNWTPVALDCDAQ